MPADINYKVFDAEEVNFTPGERSMVAWISTDRVDHENDIVIAEGIDYRSVFLGNAPDEGNPVVLASHDYGRWPLGKCEWIKLKRTRDFTGLYAKTVFDDDEDAEKVWKKIKARTLRGISIGFIPPEDLKPGEWGPPTEEELRRRPDWFGAQRVIRRCVLLEYSCCSIPMNPGALVIAAAKGIHRPVYTETSMLQKGVIPHHKSPVVDSAWDAAAAKQRVAKWASADGSGEKDMIAWAKYKQAFLWVGDPDDEITSYKLPIKDVKDGELVTVKAALHAVASVLGGGRGGVDIPEGDKAKVKSVLDAYYKDAGEDPPGEKSTETDLPRLDVLAKGDDGDDDMETMGFKKGHHVMISGGTSGSTCACIRSIHKSGKHKADDDDEDSEVYEASEDDPVAKCEMHNAKCEPTGKVKCVKCKSLKPYKQKAEDDEEVEDKATATRKEDDEEEEDEDKAKPDKKAIGEGSGGTGGFAIDDDTKPLADRPSDGDADADDLPADGILLRRGDHVAINGDGHKGYGVVMSVHKDGDFVPHVDQDVVGTEDQPAARVRRYKSMGDGFVATDCYSGHKCKHLTKVEGGLKPPTPKKSAVRPASPDPVELPPLPLPSLEGAKTAEQTNNEALLGAMARMLDDAFAVHRHGRV